MNFWCPGCECEGVRFVQCAGVHGGGGVCPWDCICVTQGLYMCQDDVVCHQEGL